MAIETLVPGVLTVCTYGGFAPVAYKDEHRKLVGKDLDYLSKFAENMGLSIEFVEAEFDGIWRLPGEGKCDVAAAGIGQLRGREVGPAQWTDYYYQVHRSLLIRKEDASKFATPDKVPETVDLVVTRNSAADLDAKERYPHKPRIAYVDQFPAKPNPQARVVELLLAGNQGDPHVDALGEGDICNKYFKKLHDDKLVLADVHLYKGHPEFYRFVVSNASVLLVDLNVFIAENKYDDEL